MRIGEVLKLRLGDLQDHKLILSEPKSGKEYEFFFIPQKVADRLREYALEVCSAPSDPKERGDAGFGFTPFMLASKDTQN